MFLNQFKNVGQALFNRGLVSSHSGNLSIKIGDRLIITRRECNLGALEERDLVETGINKNDRATPLASGELQIHRAIYQNTPARAIVHAHPIHAIALSMTEKVISSDHLEEFCALGRVPVVGTGTDVRAPDLTDNLVDALKGHRIAVVYGHGSFAVGQLLDEAFNCTTGLEEACEILCLMKSMQIKISPDK